MQVEPSYFCKVKKFKYVSIQQYAYKKQYLDILNVCGQTVVIYIMWICPIHNLTQTFDFLKCFIIIYVARMVNIKSHDVIRTRTWVSVEN